MKSIKLLTILAFVLAFAGCEVVVTDDLSSYETGSYTTYNLDEIQLCSINRNEGDVRNVNANTCGSWYYIDAYYSYMNYRFTPNLVTKNDYDGFSNSTLIIKFPVMDVYAFRYAGDIYIYYDVGGGEGFEYNYTREEVGYYDGRGNADFYK